LITNVLKVVRMCFFVKQEALEWGICNSLFWEEENIIKLRNTIGVKCW